MKVRGINVHQDYADGKLVSNLGCQWVRVDINWWTVELSNDNYTWGPVDNLVNTYYSNGMKVYATLMGSPRWHRPEFRNPPSIGVWMRFCTAVARRYGKKIAVYSLWNEPNLGKTFWTGGMKEFFQTVVAPGAMAIKSVDRNLQVASADFATLASSDWPKWLTECKHHLDNVDIVSVHVYRSSGEGVISYFKYGKVPVIGYIIPKWGPLNRYLKKLKRKIYLTEVGLAAKFGNTKQMKKQKELVKTVQDGLGDIGVSEAFFYCLKDEDPYIEDPYGFYSISGEPKTVVTD